MYKADRGKVNGWKYGIAGLMAAGAIVGAGYGFDYVSNFSNNQMKKAIAKEPGYRSLTNGSLVLHPIESEWEAKNSDIILDGCAKRLGIKKPELVDMLDKGDMEMTGRNEGIDWGNLKVGDKVPFPPECE